jgi:hypothetical protein
MQYDYGALVEWYCQGKYKAFEGKTIPVFFRLLGYCAALGGFKPTFRATDLSYLPGSNCPNHLTPPRRPKN